MNEDGTAVENPRKPKGSGSSSDILKAFRASEERYKLLVKQLPVGVYRTTPDGQIVEANPALARMLGVKKPSDLFHHNVKDFYVDKVSRAEHLRKLTMKQAVYTEFELRGVRGRRFWVRDFSRAVKGSHGKVLYFDGILVDITEQTRAAKKLERTLDKLRKTNRELAGLSLTDELTGLHNRRGFFTLGQQQMKIAKRIKKEIFLVFLDIDNLKKTNDAFGHTTGDKLLTGVASILKTTLREADVIARIGGDEFAVLAMRSKTSSEKMLLRRIDEQVRLFNRRSQPGLSLSLSTGIVRYDAKKFATLEAFLTQADFLMYQQKRSKRNSTPEIIPSKGDHLI